MVRSSVVILGLACWDVEGKFSIFQFWIDQDVQFPRLNFCDKNIASLENVESGKSQIFIMVWKMVGRESGESGNL